MRQSKMSGRSKKILAVFLAAAMIAGNALTVLAEDVSGNKCKNGKSQQHTDDNGDDAELGSIFHRYPSFR